MVDIQGSRRLQQPERVALQRYLTAVVSYLNCVYRGHLERDVVFSAGDELQGLFKHPAAAFLFYRSLLNLIGEFEIRGGIGIGGWETRIDGAPSTAQDGSAYHAARNMLHEAKKSRLYSFMVDSGSYPSDITVLANYPLLMCESRTKSQAIFARYIEFLSPIVLNNDGSVEAAREKLLDGVLKAIGDLSTEATPYELVPKYCNAVFLNEMWGDPLEALSNDLVVLSYALEDFGYRRRQSIDRLFAKSRINAERVAAATVARFLMHGEWR